MASVEALSPEFKADAVTEIAELKADIARRVAGAADHLDDATHRGEPDRPIGHPQQLRTDTDRRCAGDW